MKIIAPFTSLLFGILATTGNALKTLVIVNFPEKNEMTSFREAVTMSGVEKRDDVILLENPDTITDLRVKLGSFQGTFDRAVIQTHGNFNGEIPIMALTGNNDSLEVTDLIREPLNNPQIPHHATEFF